MNTTAPAKKLNSVMVIEDEVMLLETITRKLQNNQMETISCRKAEQALDYLENVDHLPDAIWLDFYLKGRLDGLDFLQALKSNETWKNIPVLVVSNTASHDKVKSMLALGATKYVIKAENRLEDVVKTLTSIIELE